MRPERETAVREAARDLLIEVWRRRKEFWSDPPSPEGLVRAAPETIITGLLGLRLDKPEEIAFEPAGPPFIDPKTQIAGLVDRRARRIVVAQKFRLEWRRFTTAHEIGHWTLHSDLVYHRDRPLMGGERADGQRPAVEQEADLFGAELLMPTKLVSEAFLSCFGRPIDGSKPDEALAFRLSASAMRKFGAVELAQADPIQRALLVARATTFTTKPFVPLAARFCVSPTAMAIQLVDLGLVR